MKCVTTSIFAILTAVSAAAETFILPVFAYNVDALDGNRWSTEIHLTNPGERPVQVTLSGFLPGTISKPAPCDLFMPPTRVVPGHSAVVWTAAGLATDLGCAESALGGLILAADGPVEITSRTVNHPAPQAAPPPGLLTGHGQEFRAIPFEELGGPGTRLLGALLWHRNPCGQPAFDTAIGIANPNPEPAEIVLDLPGDALQGGVLVNGEEVAIPYALQVPAWSWRQLRLRPVDRPDLGCLGPQTFVARVTVDRPVAVYASVVDRLSGDPRTVHSVPLE
jgi:hypothetical protein